MNRRNYFTTIGAVVTVLAGCSSDDSGDSVSSVDLGAEDASPSDSTATLRVSYSAETRTELPTDPPTLAEDGHKWLVVEMEITNEGDEVHEISPSRYVVWIDGEMHEFVVTKGDRSLRGEDVDPGESVSGEVVFHIPEETTAATLAVRDDVDVPRPVTVTFTREG
jgi:archaellum component FlaG (FlaF/FlaG flagellin family)